MNPNDTQKAAEPAQQKACPFIPPIPSRSNLNPQGVVMNMQPCMKTLCQLWSTLSADCGLKNPAARG